MRWLPDCTLAHLGEVVDLPDLGSTRYRLAGRLGRGGMGAVYRAVDGELGREVAVKVLAVPGADLDPASPEAERLRREARILARLEHPGIVPVHDVGTLADGRAYYVMKLVQGRSLAEHLVPAVPLAERLRIFERVCEAVAFAHAHGVVHRDLKPDNVMVGDFGEVLVVDWGVAKLRRPGAVEPPPAAGPVPAAATRHGTVVGTPGFMAPEQERGDVESVDERSDVYSLGALLAFLLGREGEAPPPLLAVVAKATAEAREDRYAGAADLAADVARFTAGLAVGAYRERWTERVVRFVRLYRTPIALLVAYLAVRLLLLLWARI